MKRTAAAKARTVAHHHRHVKPAAAHAKGATGHAHKHHKAAKHHAKPHKHKGTVARGLAIGAEVASCAAEALAASLRLQGHAVSDADVLALHRQAGGTADEGVTIEEALAAAWLYGLGGIRPVTWRPAEARDFMPAHMPALILGVDLPGAHTVLAAPDGWWSWGELYCPCEFPDAVVEEAWWVEWR